jgi:hypothetical protein
MPEPIRPEFDYNAFGNAGLAYIESPAPTTAGRTEDAVRAYLYTVANVQDGLYPSWHEVRSYLEEVRHE